VRFKLRPRAPVGAAAELVFVRSMALWRTISLRLSAWLMAPVSMAVAVDNAVGIVSEANFRPPTNTPGRSAWIPLQHIQQENNLCVPTCAAIVLQHYGRPIAPREIKSAAVGKQYQPNTAFTDFSITMYEDLLKGLFRLGVNWHLQTYPGTRAFISSLNDLKRELDRGKPVLVDTCLYPPVGHTMVVNGYDDSRQLVFMIDTNAKAPGVRAIDYKDFEQIWNSRLFGFSGRAAIFTR
jgi:uncharacterized protein YvpB